MSSPTGLQGARCDIQMRAPSQWSSQYEVFLVEALAVLICVDRNKCEGRFACSNSSLRVLLLILIALETILQVLTLDVSILAKS
jgi:hypothetical protein